MMEVHAFKPFKPDFGRRFKRADLEIYGIDHYRPSYSGLVFFNAGKIDAAKVDGSHPNCGGMFSVFGHPECVGDEGHCSPSVPGRFDTRRSHPLTRAFKRVTVTEALRAALEDGGKLQITIVVSDGEGAGKRGDGAPDRLFACDGLQIVTFA
jgi:hypothetical protein